MMIKFKTITLILLFILIALPIYPLDNKSRSFQRGISPRWKNHAALSPSSQQATGFSEKGRDKEIDTLLSDSSKAFSEKKTENGLILLDKAARIAEEEKDADACLKIGLIYVSLPPELERKPFAISILKKGAEFAQEKEKWIQLDSFANGLQNLGEKDSAISIYDQIFLKAGELKDKDSIAELKKRYEELGDAERADICGKMIDALTIPPPPNWQALGETVRNAKGAPEVSQQYQRTIADQEIQGAMDYFREKKKLEEQKKKKPIPAGGLSYR